MDAAGFSTGTPPIARQSTVVARCLPSPASGSWMRWVMIGVPGSRGVVRPRACEWRHDRPVPFTCEACGGRSWPDLIPAIGKLLRCPLCAAKQSFVRPPLLVVTGTVGTGKSSLCARLAGTIPGAVLLDADIFALDMVSVVPPNEDYRAFWRSMMRLAHELAQNDVVVVYFSTMLPEQLLANSHELNYFEFVEFLALKCQPEGLRARLVNRDGDGAVESVGIWVDFNDTLVAAAEHLPTASLVDAGRPLDLVERDVRDWITERLRG
jgi:hypothetical protein